MYNPYDPYGYLFPGQRMASPPMYQPMGTGMPQAQQTPQGDAPVVLQVATVKQVEQATVQPGSKALVLVANEPVIAFNIPALVRLQCCNSSATLTLELSTTATLPATVTVNNVGVVVEKV